MTSSRRVLRTASLLLLGAVVLVGVGDPAGAGDRTDGGAAWALRVGRLHVGDGSVLENVLVVLREGRIESVGAAEAPDGVEVRAFPDAVAAPGLVDAVTQLGLAGGGVENVEVLTPGVRAADAFDGSGRDLRGLVRTGITTVGLVPAPLNVAAGRAGSADTGPDGSVARSAVGPDVFALTTPALRGDRVPATLAGARRLLECAFAGRRWETPGEPDLPLRDGVLSRMASLHPGPALVWADDLNAAEAAKDLLVARGFRPTLVGLGAAWRHPDALADLGLPCVVTALSPESPAGLLALPGELAARGVTVVLSSGAPSRDPRSLRLALALAVARGLPPEKAVPAVTSLAAAAIGLGDRVGRVAAGLEADLVLLDGDPWEPAARVLLVVQDGRIELDAGREQRR